MIAHLWRKRRFSIALALVAGFLCLGFVPSARAQNCVPVYGATIEPERLAGLTCTLISRETVATRHAPVQLSVWTRSPPVTGDLESRARTLGDFARRSIQAYDAFAPLPEEINVIVGQGPEPWRRSTMTAGRGAAELLGERCVVDMTLAALDVTFPGGSDEQYHRYQGFAVAHEIFHCVQHLNFPEYMANFDQHRWWADAEAEYFPSTVVPRISDFFERFDEESLYHSMFEMGGTARNGYANVPFFAYLDAHTNADRIYNWTRRLPANGDYRAQAAQLYANDLFFQYDLQGFAKAFFSGALPTRYPGNEIYETHPEFEPPFTVAGNVDLGFAPESAALIALGEDDDAAREIMRFYRGRLVLPAHHRYRVAASGGGIVSVLADGYDWVDNPSGVVDTCDAPVSALAVATALDPSTPFRPQISIREERGEAPVCGPRDPCLVGRWSVDQSEMERISRTLGAGAHVTVEHGPIEIAFAASGVWELVYKGLTVRWQSELGPARLAFHGSGEGRWSAAHGSVMASLLADDSHERLQVGRAPGTDLPGVISAMSPSPTGMPYACSGDTLTFTRGSAGPLVYHRVSRDPGYPSRSH